MTATLSLADIQKMDVPAFVQLVRNNLPFIDPNADPVEAELRREIWAHLTDRSLIGRTHQMLSDLLRGVDDQLATRKAAFDVFHQECQEKGPVGRRIYFQGKAEYEDWRQGILDTKQVIALRHSHVKQVAEMYRRANAGSPPPPNPAKRKHNTDALFRLAYAVAKHRDAYTQGEILPLPEDLELWEALETLTTWTVDGIIPLDKWLDDVTSQSGFRPRPGM